MAQLTPTLPARGRSWPAALVLAAALTSLAFGLRATDLAGIAALQNLFLVFASLLIEAIPFVLLGAIVSALIEVAVPERVFHRMAALPRPLQLPAAGFAGMAFPVCECGSVPVARRLAAKGLSPAAAVTFMLAAPIINPVVIASTIVAYRGRESLWTMVIGRAGLGLIAAMAVGWVVSRESKESLLRARSDEEQDHAEHDRSKTAAFFSHLSGDFFFMGRYLVLGAFVAASLQTFVPQDLIASVAETPVLSLVAMMGLAFLLSLCSESDAFVAASFVQFGVGSQLAFLVYGPMVDTKLGFLYSASFSGRFFRTTALTVAAVVLAGTAWIEVVFG